MRRQCVLAVLLVLSNAVDAFTLHPPLFLGTNSWSARASGLCALRGTSLTVPVCVYEEHVIKTSKRGPPVQDITVEDLTPTINAMVKSSGVQEGTVTVVSRHTTTSVTINEWESRLVDDIRSWLLKLAPPDDRSAVPIPGGGVTYSHNDVDKRPDSQDEQQRCLENGWDITTSDGPRGLAAWRAQEPINAHSHLLSMRECKLLYIHYICRCMASESSQCALSQIHSRSLPRSYAVLSRLVRVYMRSVCSSVCVSRSLVLGSSEAIPVHKGKIVLGQWQSVMLVDLDGPRDRTVGLQVTGFK